MGVLAMLPSNKCGAHETFHDWSIPQYTAAFVVPFVSDFVLVGPSIEGTHMQCKFECL
jgi:hypothetical protein